MADFTLISTVTTSGSQATVTFSSIPQTYTNLLIVALGQANSSGGSNLALQFNSDTANNYARYMWGTANAGNGTFGVGSLYLGEFAGTLNGVDSGAIYARIPGYTSTAFGKVVVANWASNNARGVGNYGGFWFPAVSAAITQIDLTMSLNFVNGSIISLYGMA